MPHHNHFRHQTYRCEHRTSHPQLLRVELPPPAASSAAALRWQRVEASYRTAGVRAVYLVHGTFVGADSLGLFRDLARIWPDAGAWLAELQKQVVDRVAHDHGNYTAEYAAQLQAHLQRENAASGIPVHLFHWSGENHHVGRADAAIHLIDILNTHAAQLLEANASAPSSDLQLPTSNFPPPPHILLWCHSHGGNVLALVTNLLGADTETRERFFAAARPYYRWPVAGHVDLPIWPRVAELLRDPDLPLRRVTLDIVTFGTPVRYGWDAHAYGRLLHIVHHRPRDDFDPFRAPFPLAWEDISQARSGDVLQQIGIAGTNIAPPPLNLRALWADRRLNKLLQPGLRKRDLLERLKLGLRLPDEGETLLVDYGPMTESLVRHVAGHAIYTELAWQLVHAELTAEHLYRSEFAA